MRLLLLLGALLAPLASHAQSVPPEHVHSIMYSPYRAAFQAAREREAERRGIDVSFMHGGGGLNPSGGSAPVCSATGTQYYVSASLPGASDSNDGLFPAYIGGSHGPWSSIAKVNSPGLNFTANQCVNFYGQDTFVGCLVLKNGVNVSGSSAVSPMYVSSYGTGTATINSNCPGDQTAAFTIDGVNGIIVEPLNVHANGTMTQYGFLIINSGGSQSGPVTVNLGDVSGFWTNINTNGSTAAEVYYSGGYGAGGINGIHLIGGTLHGASVTSPDDGGIVGNNNGAENILNLTITGTDIYNMGSVPGGCNGSSNCPGRGEGILIDGVNGATVSFVRVHDIGTNVNTCGGPSGIETYASNNVLVEWAEVYFVRPLNGVYPGAGCDFDDTDMDDGSTNVIFQFIYSHGAGGAGHLFHSGTVGSFGYGPNTYRYNISENDLTLGAQVGGGFGSITFSGQSSAVAKVAVYNNTVYQTNTGTHGPYSPIGLVGNGTPTAGSFFANNALITASGNPDYQCLNYAGGNLSLGSVAFKANGYSGGSFSATGCNSGNVSTLAAWQAVASGGDAGAITSSPAFAGTPPFGNLSWNPATQTGQLPGPAGYEPTAAAYINTGLNLTVAPYNQSLPTKDFSGATIPTGTGTGYPIGANVGSPPVISGPALLSLTSSCSGTVSSVGTVCTYSATFNSAVFVGGSWHPRLNLGTTPVPSIAYYCGGSGTAVIKFCHTLWGGQSASPVVASAINLNGATIQNSGGVSADLTAANSATVTGLNYTPGNAYCVTVGGNDSSSGICGSASFATPGKAQTAMRSGAVKTAFIQSGGGTYSGLPTCNFGTNTGATRTAFICQSSADNNTVLAAYPGQSPVFDGGSTNSGNGVFVAFTSTGTTGITRQGLTIQNFSGGGYYDYSSINLNATDNTIQNLHNSDLGNGAGGCTYILDFWTNANVSNNLCQNVEGFGITSNSGQSGTGGFTFTKVFDRNKIITSCTVTGDCSALYGGWFPYGNIATLPVGTSKLTNNYIKDVGSPNSQGVGVYLDDIDSGELVQGNIVTGIYTYGTLIHAGSNNTITNNVFDLTTVSPHGSSNDTAFYMPTSSANGPPFNYSGTATNNQINKNIVYNGNPTSAPPAFMGLYYGTSQLTPPTFGVGWYWTTTGSFSNPPFCWAGTTFGGGSSGVCNSAGSLTNPQFVNAAAGTPAGFQLQAISAVLAAGFPQPAQDVGPR